MTETLTIETLGRLPVSSPTEDQFLNLLIYGQSGVGKTVLAGSASVVPELGNVLILDMEGGTRSLKDRYPDVHKIRIANFVDFNYAYDQLRAGKHDFQTVVIDSLTEARWFGMQEVMRRALNNDPDRDPDLPGIGEWGKNIEQTKRLVRAFRDLPMNTIFLCLETEDKDKRGRRMVRPSLPGKLAGEVAAFLDIVLYMYKREDGDTEQVKRYLLSQSTEEYIAKDRTDRLPTVIEEPTMQTLFDFIMSSDDT